MEKKLNFAILVCKWFVPATEKGGPWRRDKLGQDSAKFRWIQLPMKEGRGGTNRGTAGLWGLGPACPAWAPAGPLHPHLLVKAKQAVRPQTRHCTVPSLGTHSHSPVLALCGILGLWNKSILDRTIASSIAVMVIPCCCFNIPLGYVHDFLGREYVVIPQTQTARTLQKQQYKDKKRCRVMKRKGKGACVWHRLCHCIQGPAMVH